MPLYLVTFDEHGGYRCQCRIRAAAGADPLSLAVQKVWGETAFWCPAPGSETEGRVYECLGDEDDDHVPRTGRMTVSITPSHHRVRQ